MRTKRNVTVTLEQETARWARVSAARADKSVSQFVGELLYAQVLRKDPAAREPARAEVRDLQAWNPVAVSLPALESAWALQDRYRLPFWDALIVAAAKAASCLHLLSEDFQVVKTWTALSSSTPSDQSRPRCSAPRSPRGRGRGAKISPPMSVKPAPLPANTIALIREIASRHGVRDVRLFGSHVRGEARAGSDLDLLIRLEPGRGFRDFMDFCEELEESLKVKVDVVPEDGLSRFIRDQVLAEAVPL